MESSSNAKSSWTLANDVKLEGGKVQEAIEEVSEEILEEHDFTTKMRMRNHSDSHFER